MQTTARKNDWPLDKTVIITDVTKKSPEQIDAPSRDGAFVHGLFLEGARWDEKTGQLEDSHNKELSNPMPVSNPCHFPPFSMIMSNVITPERGLPEEMSRGPELKLYRSAPPTATPDPFLVIHLSYC